MRRHALISIIAGGSLAVASCAGSNDVADQAADTTLAPEPVPATEPASTEPASSEPASTEPGSTEPASSEPASTEPASTEPASSEPIATEPVATEAPTTEPAVTEAPSTEPATSDATETAATPFVVPPGAASTISALGFDDTVAAATAAIEGNDALTLVATIDHAANASNAGLELAPTTELVFGNPMIGTPLMVASPGVGIDLPQKILVVEADDGTVQIFWNSSSYLATRHGLTGVDEQLTTVDMALTSIASAAAGNGDGVEPILGPDAGSDDGLTSREAPGTAREAADRLLAAIEANPDLILVAEIDHSANAANAGLELSPIIEVVFGNPNLGTPLMQAARTVGIDLPQKMLFVDSADGVTVTFNDPAYVAQRHGIDPSTPELSTITGALESLSGVAAGADG